MRIRKLRKLTEQAQAQLTYLDAICFPHDDRYDFSEGHWWAAYDGPHPVAYAGLQHDPAWADTPLWYLCRCGVVPPYRGRGLQYALLKARLRWLRATQEPPLDVVTYTVVGNAPSANNLIRAGLSMTDAYGWAGSDVNYWQMALE